MSRVVIVTGGTRGIGAAISTAFAKAGYKVAATYHGNDQAAAEFTAQTGVQHFKFDVSDFAACEQGVANIVAKLGPVDILVNNAGITRDAFLHKMTAAQWHEVIGTNLNSVFNMSRQVIEGMRTREFGRIVNISSINGQTGQVGQANYSAAKAAIIGFTKALALESASKGVLVNAIAPGYIDTDMVRAVPPDVLEKIIAKIPVKHLGHADDIARMALFLASDDNKFATGATFTVNGAQYLT
ncbi:MAG: acetoacetyl-CoA reductase [Alphaproteobacteria bacterium]|nr:acetoacetyl-CoA reductase [Alphaproteobacteria bacterium]MBV8548624.1 acetoacetyl-CoA reductase [Alphaproteobacteria bacterium]